MTGTKSVAATSMSSTFGTNRLFSFLEIGYKTDVRSHAERPTHVAQKTDEAFVDERRSE
jgi:hypothetical protein